MTENEKLILEIADALMHLDGRTVRDDAKVRVSGTFPEPLWDAVFDAAEDIKAQATKPESDALKVKLTERVMTNEQLIVKLSGALTKVRDWRNDVPGTGEISLGGYMPEELWHVLHTAAETILSNKLMDPQFFTFVSDQLEGQAARERTDSVEDQLNALKAQVAALSSMVETMQQPSCKPSYDKLLERVENLEDEGAFQNHVEAALVNIMEAAVATDDFANFHRKFAALLKYHFGKLARSQP